MRLRPGQTGKAMALRSERPTSTRSEALTTRHHRSAQNKAYGIITQCDGDEFGEADAAARALQDATNPGTAKRKRESYLSDKPS